MHDWHQQGHAASKTFHKNKILQFLTGGAGYTLYRLTCIMAVKWLLLLLLLLILHFFVLHLLYVYPDEVIASFSMVTTAMPLNWPTVHSLL